MRIQLYIARQLRLSSRKKGGQSLAVSIATASVAVAIAIMLLTISITDGFKSQITDTINDFDGHISIIPVGGYYDQSDQDAAMAAIVSEKIREVVPEATITARCELPAMLKTSDAFQALMLRGISKDIDIELLKKYIKESVPGFDIENPESPIDDDEDVIIISSTTASQLQLEAGDNINAVFFIDSNVRLRNPRIVAIYDSSFPTYDKSIAFTSAELVQRLYPDISGYWDRLVISDLRLKDIPRVKDLVNELLFQAYGSGMTPMQLSSVSILDTSANMFSWLSLLDTNVVVIIILMGAIALFTLTSTLFILVLERIRFIGTLRTIGASNMFIRQTFIALLIRIMIRGLIYGNIIALGIIALQGLTHVIPLDPDAYFMDFVPVKISFVTILIVNLSAIVAALMAMVLPSAIISRMRPANAIRFE